MKCLGSVPRPAQPSPSRAVGRPARLGLCLLFCLSGPIPLNAQEHMRQQVVKVVNYQRLPKGRVSGGTGTGFVLNSEGYIATNHHVVGRAKAVYILPDGLRARLDIVTDNKNADVIWSSPDLDLALIRMRPEGLDAMSLVPATLTPVIPDKGVVVKAIGFPGVADTLAAETADVVADSTVTSGNVGRLLQDGFWIKGGERVRIVQHSAFIHGGNSGGPLIDECDRVVGVNTAAPRDLIRDGNNNVIGAGSLAGYYYASDIRELMDVLERMDIEFHQAGASCLSAEQELEVLLRRGMVAGAAGFTLLGVLVAFAMRNPKARARVEHIVESYSRRISPGGGGKAARARAQPRPSPGASRTSVVLDGYGATRIRLVISQDALERGEVVVGREPADGRYAIDDPNESISRKHCAFSLRSGRLYVRDLHSTNGTRLNGTSLSPGTDVELNNGADLHLGSTSFRVIAG